jgi:hypothetical protein
MSNTNYIGCVGASVVALGIGVALAASPWVASADSSNSCKSSCAKGAFADGDPSDAGSPNGGHFKGDISGLDVNFSGSETGGHQSVSGTSTFEDPNQGSLVISNSQSHSGKFGEADSGNTQSHFDVVVSDTGDNVLYSSTTDETRHGHVTADGELHGQSVTTNTTTVNGVTTSTTTTCKPQGCS